MWRCFQTLLWVPVLMWMNGHIFSLAQSQSDYESVKNDYYCPREKLWNFLQEDVGDGYTKTKNFCFGVFNARSFHEAVSHCRARQAQVFSLSQSYHLYGLPSGPELFQFLANNGISNLWHGYYVKDGRLRKDVYPMDTVDQETIYQRDSEIRWNIPWERSDSADEPSGASNCFEMHINFTNPCPSLEENPELGFGSGQDLLLPGPDLPGLQPTGGDPSPPEAFARRKRASDAKDKVKAMSRVKRVVEEEAGGDCVRRKVVVRSRPCADALPFLCVKPALKKDALSLYPADQICRPDEYGSYEGAFSRCFSFGKEDMNHTTAVSRCANMKNETWRPRQLYRPLSQASSSFLDGLLVQGLRDYYGRQQEEVSTQALSWAARWFNGARQCLGLMLNPKVNATVSWDCQAILPYYICQHAITPPDVGKLALNVTGVPDIKIRRIPNSDDIQASIPYNYTVYGESETQDFVFISCLYDSPLVPQLQVMSLIKGGQPISHMSRQNNFRPVLAGRNAEGLGQVNPRITYVLEKGYTDQNSEVGAENRMSDYYWCEINDVRTGQIHRSGRVFVRAKEVETYTASIAANPTVHSRSDLMLFSMTGGQNDFRIKSDFDSALRQSEYYARILRIRPNLFGRRRKRSSSDGIIVDFHVFKKVPGETEFNPTKETLRKALASLRSDFEQSMNSTRFNFNARSLQLRSIDICPSTTVYDPISERTYDIPDTGLGLTYTSPEICLSNGEPYVTLECRGDKLYGAYWSQFSPNQGCNFTEAPTSPNTNSLKNISISDINEDSLDGVVEDTRNVVNGIDGFNAIDIIYFADIVQRASDLDNITKQTGQEILDLVDRMYEVENDTLEDSNKLGNATNRIIKAIDELGEKIVLDDDTFKVRLVSNSTAIEVWNLNKVTGDVIIGLELLLDGGEPVPVLESDDLVSLFENASPTYKETDAAILLSAAFVRQIQNDNPGKDVRLSMNLFAETALFKLGRLERVNPNVTGDALLNSKVISAKVTVDGVPVTDLADKMVTTVYLPIVKLPEEKRATNTTCVFWDFSGAKGQGAWSDRGCRYDRTLEGRDVCVCDHLTNFAVLLDFYGQPALPTEHQTALSIITIIGLSLSIAGLSITVISFLIIKKLRQGRPQQTLFNMALAMLASWLVFLAGFTRVEHHGGCVAVAAMLHYFILASFMWMLMEGILQYLLFVKVLGVSFDNYMCKTAIPAWGLPLIPVIVVLAIDPNLYRGGEQYCWMSLTPFYYAFLAPVALVMLSNIIVYIMVVVNICRRGRISSSGTNKRAVGIRASVACFIVLGLSWVFAFFAIEDARLVFQYLFTITTSLQGFLIFLVFTARDPSIRAFWKSVCCRKGKADRSSTGKTKGSHDDHLHHQRLRTHQSGGSDEVALGPALPHSYSGSSTDSRFSSRTTSPMHLTPSNSHSGNGYGNGVYARPYDNMAYQ